MCNANSKDEISHLCKEATTRVSRIKEIWKAYVIETGSREKQVIL
jgi:hypothetical protein